MKKGWPLRDKMLERYSHSFHFNKLLPGILRFCSFLTWFFILFFILLNLFHYVAVFWPKKLIRVIFYMCSPHAATKNQYFSFFQNLLTWGALSKIKKNIGILYKMCACQRPWNSTMFYYQLKYSNVGSDVLKPSPCVHVVLYWIKYCYYFPTTKYHCLIFIHHE